MSSPTDKPRSHAARASWVSLGLALGCAAVFFIGQMVDQISPFDRSNGLLTGFLPRTMLYLLWAGEALAVVVGIASFCLIRHVDVASMAIVGIVARCLLGIAGGLFGSVFFWLVVGHIVIGFWIPPRATVQCRG